MTLDLTCVSAGAICFVLGYVAGRVDLILLTLREQHTHQPVQSFFSKKAKADDRKDNKPAPVAVDDIDTRVYVAPIATDNLTKTNESQLGKTSVTADNINQSVSKLSQLKGR